MCVTLALMTSIDDVSVQAFSSSPLRVPVGGPRARRIVRSRRGNLDTAPRWSALNSSPATLPDPFVPGAWPQPELRTPLAPQSPIPSSSRTRLSPPHPLPNDAEEDTYRGPSPLSRPLTSAAPPAARVQGDAPPPPTLGASQPHPYAVSLVLFRYSSA